MGYRSEFMLAFRGPEADIYKLKEWLALCCRTETDDIAKGETRSRKSIFRSIIDYEISCIYSDIYLNNYELLYGHEYVKCYQPWGIIILEILAYARDTLRLKAAYARCGEDYGDVVMDDKHNLYIGYKGTLISPF